MDFATSLIRLPNITGNTLLDNLIIDLYGQPRRAIMLEISRLPTGVAQSVLVQEEVLAELAERYADNPHDLLNNPEDWEQAKTAYRVLNDVFDFEALGLGTPAV